MSISQSYYTSSMLGVKGGHGFQTQAATPSMPPGVIASLERLGGYAPPSSAPTRPTPEEIKSFPVSLIFSRLPDGDAAIGQSKYLGKDYSGRYGNYFAHFVVVPAGDLVAADYLPIGLWRSGLWQTAESPTTELPALERLQGADELLQDEVVGLVDTPEMRQRFAQMISAVERALEGGPRLIIAAPNKTVAEWIALVTRILPAPLAWSVSFTTYAKNPAFANATIAGTTLDSDFGFTDFEIKHQFAVFDFLGDRFSPIQISPFARMVMEAIHHPGAGNPFFFPEFVARVALELPLRELAVAFSCYALVNHQPYTMSPEAICDWCKLHVSALKASELSSIMASLQQEAAASPSGQKAIESLVRAGVQAGRSSEVIPAFVNMVLHVLPSADLGWLREVPALLRQGHARGSASDARIPLADLTDPARLGVALSILDELALLEGKAAELRLVGNTLVGARLHEPATRRVLIEMVSKPYGKILMIGVAEALQARTSDRLFLSQLGELFQNAEAMDLLQAVAQHENFAELSMYLAAQRLHHQRVSPGEIFDKLLSLSYGLKSGVDLAGFEMAFDLAWNRQPLDQRSCAALLEMFASGPGHRVFAASSVPGSIAQSLLSRHDSLRAADLAQVAVLLRKEYATALEGKTDYLKALVILHQNQPPSTIPVEDVRHSWDLAANLDGELRTKLLAATTAMLFAIKHAKKHQEQLRYGLETFGQPVANDYAGALTDKVGRQKDPDRFIELARIWLSILHDGEPTDGACITRAFKELYGSFGKDSRLAINTALQSDTELAPQWADLNRSTSFFGRAKSWAKGDR